MVLIVNSVPAGITSAAARSSAVLNESRRKLLEIPANPATSTPPSIKVVPPQTSATPAGAAPLGSPRLSGALVHDVGIDIEHRPRRLARGQQCLAER
jgi:hypothetical protein